MNNYPEQVEQRAQEAFDAMTDFCKEEPDVTPEVLYEELCKSLMTKWLDGNELVWTEEEILNVMQMAMVNSIVERLKSEGYVDSIEDENGEEYLWATPKGLAEVKPPAEDASE